MNIYGYCRISTAKQSIDRQIRNIKAEYPTAHIVQEAYTGTSIFRPEWLKLYRVLKAGDTVVFDSVSRMSRNAEEGFALYEDLYHKGIRLVFLKEHHIDTETYKKALSGSIAMTGTNVDFILKGINEYLMALAKEQIKLAFEQSEKEVADLHQRTREGLLTARLNGKQVGRKKGVGFETKKFRHANQHTLHHNAFRPLRDGFHGRHQMDTVLFQLVLVVHGIEPIPGKAVQLPDQNYVEDFLSAVLDHPLKVWAVIRFGRVGTVNVGADHGDAVLLGVVLAVAQLSLNGRFTLAVG